MKFYLLLTVAVFSTATIYAHTPTPAAAATAPQQAPVNKQEVAANAHISLNRFVLATGIEQREPRNAKENFTTADGKVFAFADLNSKGHDHVVFQWKHEGKEHAKFSAKVSDSARWRTFSHVSALPGNWSVAIVDKNGAVLKEMNFNVGGAAAAPVAAPSAPQEKPKVEEPKKADTAAKPAV